MATGSKRRVSLLEACTEGLLMAAGEEATPWNTMRATVRAARIAGFVVMWAGLLEERAGERVTIETYAAAGYDSRATSYRRLKDFQEAFPGEHDPTRVAGALLAAARKKHAQPSATLVIAV